MAIQHETAGAVIVTYQTTPTPIGYTRDGCEIRFDPRFIEISSDDFGGQSGAPSDSQIVGGTATVQCELTKYDKAAAHALTAFVGAGTAFTFPAYGTLLRQGAKTATLTLNGVNEDWAFAVAFPKSAVEMNKGVKYTTLRCGFECWVDAASTRVLAVLT